MSEFCVIAFCLLGNNSMTKSKEISDYLIDAGFDLVGPVIEGYEGNRGCVVYLQVKHDKKGNQNPSNYKIGKIEKEINSKFGETTFVLYRQGNEDIINSIKSLLIRRFPDEVRNVFSSLNGRKVSVWLELKSVTTHEHSQDLEDATREIIEFSGLELINFTNISEMRLPTKTACLSIIRRKSPITVSDLAIELRNKGFELPENTWLQRNLDRWRKNKEILRQNSGTYLMTLKALKSLGSGRNRRSQDIYRVLDMAKRNV